MTTPICPIYAPLKASSAYTARRCKCATCKRWWADWTKARRHAAGVKPRTKGPKHRRHAELAKDVDAIRTDFGILLDIAKAAAEAVEKAGDI